MLACLNKDLFIKSGLFEHPFPYRILIFSGKVEEAQMRQFFEDEGISTPGYQYVSHQQWFVKEMDMVPPSMDGAKLLRETYYNDPAGQLVTTFRFAKDALAEKERAVA